MARLPIGFGTIEPGGVLERNLAHLLEDFFGDAAPAALRHAGEAGPLAPAVDVVVRGENLIIRAELPGVASDDVAVEVAEGRLEIRGVKREAGHAEGDAYVASERRFGEFFRAIPLSFDLDAEKIEARMENGVLEILVPKSAAARPRRIEVRREGGARRSEGESGARGSSAGAPRPPEPPRAREEREKK
jgi:HSP20 family protein